MTTWFERTPSFEGLLLYPEAEPPRDAIEAALTAAGALVSPSKAASPGPAWRLTLRHPAWGAAELERLEPCPAPPRDLLALSPGLSQDERARAETGRSALKLSVPGAGGGALADRKLALRLAAAALAGTGVAAIDMASLLAWTPEALADELAHDADLDIDQVHGLHAVGSRDEPIWIHSHGLAALGAFDFDVLEPSEDAMCRSDLFRALAFAILEGQVRPDTEHYELVRPGGAIRMVPVETFTARGDPRLAHELRDAEDPGHNTDRSVVCEPVRQGFLALFSRSDGLAPASLFRSRIPDDTVVAFTAEASDLMAWRARKTLPLFARLTAELAEFEPVGLVKLGYPTEAPDAGSVEHLWFEVHRLHEDSVDATLLNAPFSVPSLAEGQRGRFPLALLSDWSLQTPAGPITPRSARVARTLKAHRTEILAQLAADRRRAD